MPAWPTALGEQLVGLTEQRQDGRLFSSMDAGPPKVRRRFTAVSKYVTAQFAFTGDQKQIFDDFYINDLSEGALAFDWEDPTTDAIVSFRASTGTPKFTLSNGGSPNGERRWIGAWNLEVLP